MIVFSGSRGVQMKYLLSVICVLMLHWGGAFAADDSGKFAMKGAGFLPCGVYVTEREKKSGTYYLVAGWVEGYITAYNKHVPDTFDITSFESLELLLAVMQNHCEANPNDRLYPVLDSMLIKLAPDRLVKESGRVEISEGQRKTFLYKETIRRIQAELARRGFYTGAIDGRFTDKTKAGLSAFQSDIKFKASGFPDQTTLWRLLRK
jgi:hypothetical protein